MRKRRCSELLSLRSGSSSPINEAFSRQTLLHMNDRHDDEAIIGVTVDDAIISFMNLSQASGGTLMHRMPSDRFFCKMSHPPNDPVHLQIRVVCRVSPDIRMNRVKVALRLG